LALKIICRLQKIIEFRQFSPQSFAALPRLTDNIDWHVRTSRAFMPEVYKDCHMRRKDVTKAAQTKGAKSHDDTSVSLAPLSLSAALSGLLKIKRIAKAKPGRETTRFRIILACGGVPENEG
jgi:hypothetical protein